MKKSFIIILTVLFATVAYANPINTTLAVGWLSDRSVVEDSRGRVGSAFGLNSYIDIGSLFFAHEKYPWLGIGLSYHNDSGKLSDSLGRDRREIDMNLNYYSLYTGLSYTARGWSPMPFSRDVDIKLNIGIVLADTDVTVTRTVWQGERQTVNSSVTKVFGYADLALVFWLRHPLHSVFEAEFEAGMKDSWLKSMGFGIGFRFSEEIWEDVGELRYSIGYQQSSAYVGVYFLF